MSPEISGFLTCRAVKFDECATRRDSNRMTQMGTFIKVNFPDAKPAVGVMTGSVTAALTFLLSSHHIEHQTYASASIIGGWFPLSCSCNYKCACLNPGDFFFLLFFPLDFLSSEISLGTHHRLRQKCPRLSVAARYSVSAILHWHASHVWCFCCSCVSKFDLYVWVFIKMSLERSLCGWH